MPSHGVSAFISRGSGYVIYQLRGCRVCMVNLAGLIGGMVLVRSRGLADAGALEKTRFVEVSLSSQVVSMPTFSVGALRR